jgi:diguanylate cyclase (GGDEF)-like protein
MRIADLGHTLTTSLHTRILLLTLAVFIAVSVPAAASFVWIVDTMVIKLGTLFAEKQILFDRYRGLGSLMREVSLAETLARAPAVRDWAFDEAAPDKRSRGIAELEHYREAFADHSYFFVVGASGNYYFNDRANSHADSQFSYRLDPANPRDGWYYKTAALGEGCHLNVDNDDVLRVTKVWINCVIVEGRKVLGVLGTGIDLTAFIREVVDIPQTGVTAMFVDRSGALQAHRDPALVDFHSLTKNMDEKKTVYGLVDDEADRARLRTMLAEVTSGEVLVKSSFMKVGGKQMLVGVGYLDRMDWYNVTFMDIDKIIDRNLFVPIGALLAAMMAAAMALVGYMFKRGVLDRLARVEGAVLRVEAGDFSPARPDPGKDEIGRLSRSFVRMATVVGNNTQMLEAMVRKRTEELEGLAYYDTLTGIFNRRGFSEAFEAARQRARLGGTRLGLLLMDLDQFKQINDTYGHQAGDKVLAATSQRIAGVIRPVDICGRWGGDEFIILIEDCSPSALQTVAQRLMSAIGGEAVTLGEKGEIMLSVSMGACLAEAHEAIDKVAEMADAALYAAKEAGRNRVVMFDQLWQSNTGVGEGMEP